MAESQSNVFQCPIATCPFFSSTPQLWLNHLRGTHEDCSQVPCCFFDCDCQPFSSFSALKSHFYRKHHISQKSASASTSIIDYDHQFEPILQDKDFSLMETTEADLSCLLGLDSQKQKQDSALFVMRMREIHKLPQVAIDDIITNCQSIFENTSKYLHAAVRLKLAEGVNDPLGVDEVFGRMTNPFAGLETKHLQDKFITDKFQVLVSKTLIMHKEQIF